ncbi:HmuY family protein [Hyalangium versicolor]|uniref:HmuY family protein n=1 Tax=Hyalangium versicolor TaxID=2861190 RepID=UPI001CCFAD7D|nr:HmuY family protein [Hyalangium versicolor]
MRVLSFPLPRFLRVVPSLILAGWMAGCGPDLKPDPGEPPATDNPDTPNNPSTDPNLTHVDNGDGSFTTTVNATRQEAWIGLDLDQRSEANGAEDQKWDLAFQRFHIRLRGGAHGTGSVEVAILSGVSFDKVTQAPAAGYTTDSAADSTAFEEGDGWYIYNPSNHKLTARELIYVVRTDAGAYFKVQLLDYYDSAGTPAMIKLRWGPVQPPSAGELQVDASDSNAWVYLQVDHGVVQVATPESSKDWDVAVRRTQFRTNGGSSGPGLGGARIAEQTDFTAVQHAPTVGYVADTEQPIQGPPNSGTASLNAVLGDWYDYDVNTHVVSPKARVFLVRTASGDYARLQITSYSSGKYTVRFTSVPRQVAVVQLAVDASLDTQLVGVKFGRGTAAAITAETASSDWDIAFRRTWIQTNSGTSGTAHAGALLTQATSLAEVTTADEGTYVEDQMMPVPGPSGSEASGNPVLNDWYDYDINTHVVTPKASIFLVKTVEGAFAKVRIVSYADGHFTLEYAYTGPARTSF